MKRKFPQKQEAELESVKRAQTIGDMIDANCREYERRAATSKDLSRDAVASSSDEKWGEWS